MTLWQNRPKHIAEYLALRFFAALFCALPHRAALAIGWLFALLAHHVFRWRTAETRRRIREVFGTTVSESRVRTIAWLSMRNLAFNAVDSIRIPLLTLEHVRHCTEDDVTEPLRKLYEEGRRVIIAIPHAGGWEQAAISLSLLGIPVSTIVGRMKNPLTDEYLTRVRSMTGVSTIHRDDHVVRTTVRNIRQGKVLAMLPDIRSRTPGVRARFLGQEANLAMGLGLFARMGNASVMPVFVSRIGWTRHRWQSFPIIAPDDTLDRDADTQRITDYVMNIFDTCIRAEPEQYFWYNKRWILDPLTSAESAPPAPEIPTTGTPTT